MISVDSRCRMRRSFSTVFDGLVQSGQLTPKPDVLPPSVPMDYDWARVCDEMKSITEKDCFHLSLSVGARIDP